MNVINNYTGNKYSNQVSFNGFFNKIKTSDPEKELNKRKAEGYKKGQNAYNKTLSNYSAITSVLALAGVIKIKEKVSFDEVQRIADEMVKDNKLTEKGFTYHYIDQVHSQEAINKGVNTISEKPIVQRIKKGIKFETGQKAFDEVLKLVIDISLTIKDAVNRIMTRIPEDVGQMETIIDGSNYNKLVENTAKGIGESPIIKPFKKLFKKFFGKTENGKIVVEMAHKKFKYIAENMLFMVSKGLNAFYMPEGNFSVTAKKRASLMMHEIGHAINANKSPVLKHLITASRIVPGVVCSLLLFNSITHSAKYEQGENRSRFTKIKDFFEANASKMAFLSFVPMICEEAMATTHGLKYAYKVLGQAKIGTFAKLYAVGLSSYIGAAALTSFAIKKASEERDNTVY